MIGFWVLGENRTQDVQSVWQSSWTAQHITSQLATSHSLTLTLTLSLPTSDYLREALSSQHCSHADISKVLPVLACMCESRESTTLILDILICQLIHINGFYANNTTYKLNFKTKLRYTACYLHLHACWYFVRNNNKGTQSAILQLTYHMLWHQCVNIVVQCLPMQNSSCFHPLMLLRLTLMTSELED